MPQAVQVYQRHHHVGMLDEVQWEVSEPPAQQASFSIPISRIAQGRSGLVLRFQTCELGA